MIKINELSTGIIVSAIRVAMLRLRLGKKVKVDFETQVGPKCRIVVAPGGVLVLRGAVLSRSVTLEVSEGAALEIGKTFVGPGSIVSARDQIRIGDGSQIADYVTIRDHNHLHDHRNPLASWRFSSEPIGIGNDVWLASKVTILAGVTVDDHALCAAGAVVTKDVGVWERVGGVPARPLGSRSVDGAALGRAWPEREN